MHRVALLATGVFAILSIFPFSPHASITTGNDLLAICNDTSLRYLKRLEKRAPPLRPEDLESTGTLCLGYFIGVLDTFTMLQRICLSEAISDAQAIQIIVPKLAAQIANDPTMGSWLAPLLILMAADAVLPCAKSQK